MKAHSWQIGWFGCLLLIVGVSSAPAAPGGDGKGDNVADLIKQLGDTKASIREKASAALTKLGLEALPALREATKDKDPERSNRARALVEELAKKTQQTATDKGKYGQVKPIAEDAVVRAFPNSLFYGLLYRQYPVGRVPPAGFGVSNVLAFEAKGEIKVIKDVKGLEAFFKANLGSIQNDVQAKDAARAWLLFQQELIQDGFYKFNLMDDSTKVMDENDGKKASAKSVVMQGGTGEINVALTFDKKGKLTQVAEAAKVRPGPRPICQATKLLDPDPLVRRICEQDLLIMGRAAKVYLDEQRAKASPELKKAIDRIWQRIVAEE